MNRSNSAPARRSSTRKVLQASGSTSTGLVPIDSRPGLPLGHTSSRMRNCAPYFRSPSSTSLSGTSRWNQSRKTAGATLPLVGGLRRPIGSMVARGRTGPRRTSGAGRWASTTSRRTPAARPRRGRWPRTPPPGRPGAARSGPRRGPGPRSAPNTWSARTAWCGRVEGASCVRALPPASRSPSSGRLPSTGRYCGWTSPTSRFSRALWSSTRCRQLRPEHQLGQPLLEEAGAQQHRPLVLEDLGRRAEGEPAAGVLVELEVDPGQHHPGRGGGRALAAVVVRRRQARGVGQLRAQPRRPRDQPAPDLVGLHHRVAGHGLQCREDAVDDGA